MNIDKATADWREGHAVEFEGATVPKVLAAVQAACAEAMGFHYSLDEIHAALDRAGIAIEGTHGEFKLTLPAVAEREPVVHDDADEGDESCPPIEA